jgi:uncharacterized Zn finger protein (UPF0148 family)
METGHCEQCGSFFWLSEFGQALCPECTEFDSVNEIKERAIEAHIRYMEMVRNDRSRLET